MDLQTALIYILIGVSSLLAANALATKSNQKAATANQEASQTIIKDLQTRLNKMESDRDEQDDRREGEIKELRSESKRLNNEIVDLRHKLDLALAELEKANGVISTYYKDQNRMGAELSTANQEIGRLGQSLVLLQQANDKLTNELKECRDGQEKER